MLDLTQFSNDTELAIVAAALLDDTLTELLQIVFRCNQEDKDQLLHNRRFKVQLAYCFRLIDARQFGDWLMLASIRNRFAHSTLPRPSFGHHRVANLVGRLSTYRAGRDRRQVFIDAVGRLHEQLERRLAEQEAGK